MQVYAMRITDDTNFGTVLSFQICASKEVAEAYAIEKIKEIHADEGIPLEREFLTVEIRAMEVIEYDKEF